MRGGSAAGQRTGTVGGALKAVRERFRAAGIGNPSGDAEVLVAHLLGWDRSRLHAHADEPLPGGVAEELEGAARRRARREPMAYILGVREFWSLPFRVTPDVLIPRPETELLVERAADLLREEPAPRVLDLGAGSGAVGVAIARELPRCRVTATDVSGAALRIARENAERNGVADRVRFLLSDLFEALPAGEGFDAIVSNPPYVCSGAFEGLMPEVARYEPRWALDGGPDGMRYIRPIIRDAPARLKREGILLLEMDPGQIPLAAAEVRAGRAFREPVARIDLAGRLRVLEARRR